MTLTYHRRGTYIAVRFSAWGTILASATVRHNNGAYEVLARNSYNRCRTMREALRVASSIVRTNANCELAAF